MIYDSPVVLSALITSGCNALLGFVVYFGTRRPKLAEAKKEEEQTVESAVNSIAQLARARLDEINLHKSTIADLTAKAAADHTENALRIEALERRVDELEIRNASLRRRIDAYELEDEKRL